MDKQFQEYKKLVDAQLQEQPKISVDIQLQEQPKKSKKSKKSKRLIDTQLQDESEKIMISPYDIHNMNEFKETIEKNLLEDTENIESYNCQYCDEEDLYCNNICLNYSLSTKIHQYPENHVDHSVSHVCTICYKEGHSENDCYTNIISETVYLCDYCNVKFTDRISYISHEENCIYHINCANTIRKQLNNFMKYVLSCCQ